MPARFGRLNPRHQTPTFAIAFIQLTGIVAILLVGLLLAPDDIFGFLGTITTLAVIILYVMANLALTAYIRREHPATSTSGGTAVLPWIGTLALLPVLFVTVYPVPSWPYNLTPYIFIAGADHRLRVHGVARVAPSRRRCAAGRRYSSARSTDEEGDVDWDAPSPPSPQAQVTSVRRRVDGDAPQARASSPTSASPTSGCRPSSRRCRVATYRARLAAAAEAAAGAGLDALLVYADREHFANLSYLTGFDPRFEEALLILVPGQPPHCWSATRAWRTPPWCRPGSR